VTCEEPAALVHSQPPQTGPIQAAGLHVFHGEALRKAAVQVHSASSQIAVPPSSPEVDVKAVPSGDAVTVEEDQIVTSSFYDGFIADRAFPKAFIRVPDVPHWKWCTRCELSNQPVGFGSAPIVGDKKLKVLKALA